MKPEASRRDGSGQNISHRNNNRPFAQRLALYRRVIPSFIMAQNSCKCAIQRLCGRYVYNSRHDHFACRHTDQLWTGNSRTLNMSLSARVLSPLTIISRGTIIPLAAGISSNTQTTGSPLRAISRLSRKSLRK